MPESTDLNIRRATPDDAAPLAELMNMAGDGIPAWLWARMAEPGEAPMDFGARRVAGNEGGFSYIHAHVATLDGDIAGMLLGYRLPDPHDTGSLEEVPAPVRPMLELEAMAPGTWYVNAVASAPAHRGHGIGTRLMQYAETLARESGAGGLSLIVARDNDRAVRLYQTLGYRETARRPIVPIPESPHEGDWLLMTKSVD